MQTWQEEHHQDVTDATCSFLIFLIYATRLDPICGYEFHLEIDSSKSTWQKRVRIGLEEFSPPKGWCLLNSGVHLRKPWYIATKRNSPPHKGLNKQGSINQHVMAGKIIHTHLIPPCQPSRLSWQFGNHFFDFQRWYAIGMVGGAMPSIGWVSGLKKFIGCM